MPPIGFGSVDDGVRHPHSVAAQQNCLPDRQPRTQQSHLARTAHRPDGTPLRLTWGAQLDIRPIAATDVEDETGAISEVKLAGYVAKYATKGTGKSEAADRPIRSQLDIDFL
ncbi:replication initiator, partial [Kibdelosporangium lantanae]